MVVGPSEFIFVIKFWLNKGRMSILKVLGQQQTRLKREGATRTCLFEHYSGAKGKRQKGHKQACSAKIDSVPNDKRGFNSLKIS